MSFFRVYEHEVHKKQIEIFYLRGFTHLYHEK